MRILRIKILNFRGVSECEVTFPTEGVTIIEGPNEIGKTSLSEAIDLVLTERDDSTKRSIKAVKPVDKDVGVEVEVEITSGPYHFIYRKRWHRQRATELQIIEPQKSQLTGRDAHDRVRAILDETLDSGLWDALRIRQGTRLEQAELASVSLGRALDLAAGGDAAGEREDDLWLRITAERDLYWTATGQEKSNRTTLNSNVTEAATEVAHIEEVLRELEGDADEVDRLQRAALDLVDKQREMKDSEQLLGAQFALIDHQRNEVERLKGINDTARADRDRVYEISKNRTDLVARVAAAKRAVDEQRSKMDGAEPALEIAGARLVEAKEFVKTGKQNVKSADTASRLAVADENYRRHQIEGAQLSERHQRIHKAVQRRTEAEGVLETNHIDDELVQRIQEAYVEVVRAEAAASAGASTISIHTLVDLTVKARGGSVDLGAGVRHDLVLTDSAEVEIPNVVRIEIAAGAEAKSKAARVAAAHVDFKSKCDGAGVRDVAEAQVASEARKEALRVVSMADNTIKQDLRDLTTEALAQKVLSLEARITAHETERPIDPPLPADFDQAKLLATTCDGELQELGAELGRLEIDESAASEALQKLQLDQVGTQATLDLASAVEERETLSLTTVRLAATDDELATQLKNAQAVLQQRQDGLQKAEDDLKSEDLESVEARLNNARDVLKRIASELHDYDNNVRDLRTKLTVKGDEGLAQQLDIAKTKLRQFAIQRDRIESRAMAAKVLYDAFTARRAEARSRYISPFRERIEGLGRFVFNSTLEIELDDELRISRRTLDGITLDFADLSMGAKEQLGLISRLACASIVSADGGAPVIFDDALGWSDPRKLDSMGAVIRTAGQSCQIIILTCTPGRYAGIGMAEVIRLPT